MSNFLQKVTATVSATMIVVSIFAPVTNAATSGVEAANKLASLGVINDQSDNPAKYRLNDTITRREMLKVMMNLSQFAVTEGCAGIFRDLKP